MPEAAAVAGPAVVSALAVAAEPVVVSVPAGEAGLAGVGLPAAVALAPVAAAADLTTVVGL